MKLVIEGVTDEPIELELDDQRSELLLAICARKGITVNEAVNRALQEFLSTHPIIRQTRTPQ